MLYPTALVTFLHGASDAASSLQTSALLNSTPASSSLRLASRSTGLRRILRTTLPIPRLLTVLGVISYLPAILCIALKMLFDRDRKALLQVVDASSEANRLTKQPTQSLSRGRDVEYGTGAAAAPLSAAAAPSQGEDMVCGIGAAAAPPSAAAAPTATEADH